MPFHALHWQGDYLIKRMAVTYLVNLTSLLVERRAPHKRRVLAIGISEYTVPSLPLRTLPYAEKEARSVAAIYWDAGIPAVALCGAAANGAQLRKWAQNRELASYSCIHVAGHGVNVPSDTPLESFLCLSDTKLDGLEIASWDLSAELVILSACSSGQRAILGRGLPDIPGDEPLGLQAAFFFAHCSCIISALWPVDDQVGLKLMQSLHQHLVQGCSAEVAHQRAVSDFLTQARLPHRHPHYWAPFFVTAIDRENVGRLSPREADEPLWPKI